MDPASTPPSRSFGELFLTYPDLFPGRSAGEAWGDQTVEVDFVGGPYRFRGLVASQARALETRFASLARQIPARSEAGAAPAIPIDVLKVSESELLDVDLKGWSYTFDRDYHPDHVRVAGLRFMGRLDGLATDSSPPLATPGARKAGQERDERLPSGALFTPEEEGPFFLSQVENFFRLLVAYRLLQLGGVLLHSAGVVSKGRAFVFFGHSGAGKSTISRLALDSGRQVLSDDMNALCRRAGGMQGQYLAEKLPFAGDLGRTPTARASYPLTTLCRLRQGPAELRPMGKAEAVSYLVGCAPFVNVDPHRLDLLSDNLIQIVSALPTHELRFPKSGGFWHLLDQIQVDDADGTGRDSASTE